MSVSFKRLLPPGARRQLWREYRAIRARALASDGRSRRTYRRLSRGPAGSANPVPVRIGALDGATVWLRPGTADAEVAWSTFVGGFHVPPADLHSIGVIWDLGANVGLTTAHFARLFPQAKVVGLELDDLNFELAIRNVARWSPRCQVRHAAVWTTDGEVSYDRESGREDGIRILPTGRHSAPAISLNTLLADFGSPDYVKMDIEGAESEVLSERTEWASQVRCISVECHPPYSAAACSAELNALGFDVEVLPQAFRRRARDTALGYRV